MFSRIKAYIKSMRLYYAFVTGIPGWLGVAFYEHIANDFDTGEIAPSMSRKFIILLLLFLSWGINQIINDYLGLKEDKLNAPSRPMVTGELPVKWALSVSGILIFLTGVITYFWLEPIALIPLILGVLLNIIYEYAKGHGIMGNISFGLMISMTPVFGFLASGPIGEPYFTKSRVSVWLIIVIINSLMTYFTYFKDYKGDKRSNKKTIIVAKGLRKARTIGLVASFIPYLLFAFIYMNDMIIARANKAFIILAVLSFFLHMWTALLYFKNPIGKKTYYSLITNFRACICSQAALIALFNVELAFVLFISSYILVGFIFNLHTNYKA
ncbi:UbiA family prenyltransferase [Alkaliphilus peptidifermentans]|uniref:Geranylgeranylglycerol-phosphate geranylgeranyltransferase n=1 Tax=Alkaliphilus peptidifermentans DSM 18978 TaxID=1120976 RepID=A0A1G5I9Z2_9FIRM|nr:UbiA family prenyltransferase [Alkaliphilus peptidifermentans]SCY72787.1 geranylgeranylglycerol-phosphate geranylgeranyltransferase [Alkaliphilus peptidifermentans DSM 18978]